MFSIVLASVVYFPTVMTAFVKTFTPMAYSAFYQQDWSEDHFQVHFLNSPGVREIGQNWSFYISL